MKCFWCDETSVTEIEIQPAQKGKDKRTQRMVIKKPAWIVPACKEHRNIVDKQPPFYTCGCSYVEGEHRCPRHDKVLKQPHRDRLTKELIKDAHK